jgi:SAM-dependent methyltransferase
MRDIDVFPKKGINGYVSAYLSGRSDLAGKKILDCPAGDGRTSQLLTMIGAEVISADLFPEFFKINHPCDEVDITLGLPYPDNSFDMIVCQEGIEHFPNQLQVLKEFSRVIKKGGELIITTPNASHLRAKVSFLLNESDYYKRTPPSELDGVWFSHRDTKDLYFGHVFFINNQKLRTLGVFSGLEIKRHHGTQIGTTSLLLYPFLFPFILISNLMPYLFYRRKFKRVEKRELSKIMNAIFKLNISFKTLVCKHTMMSMVKVRSEIEAVEYLKRLTRS